jgi:hypothetical protein
MKTILCTLAFCAFTLCARAETVTPITDGNSLLALLQADAVSKHETQGSAYTTGYIQGCIEMAAYSHFGLGLPKISIDQATQVIFKYLKEHPGKLRNKATGLVVAALSAGFPEKVGH